MLVLELHLNLCPYLRLVLVDYEFKFLAVADLDIASDVVLDRLEGHASEDVYSVRCQYVLFMIIPIESANCNRRNVPNRVVKLSEASKNSVVDTALPCSLLIGTSV